jgi:hypothetical protein
VESLDQLVDTLLSFVRKVENDGAAGKGTTAGWRCNAIHDDGPPVEVADFAPVFRIKARDDPENRSIFDATDAQ